MSEQEQCLVAGQALLEYGEVRKQFAALVRKAATIAECLKTVSVSLSPNTQNPQQASFGFGARWQQVIQGYPSREEIIQLAEEIQATAKRKFDLAGTLRDLGCDPRD